MFSPLRSCWRASAIDLLRGRGLTEHFFSPEVYTGSRESSSHSRGASGHPVSRSWTAMGSAAAGGASGVKSSRGPRRHSHSGSRPHQHSHSRHRHHSHSRQHAHPRAHERGGRGDPASGSSSSLSGAEHPDLSVDILDGARALLNLAFQKSSQV